MNTIIHKNILRKRMLWLVMIGLAVYLIQERITIVFTESVNATILWHSNAEIKLWDFANYRLEEEKITDELKQYTRNGYLTVTKRVACMDGQLLEKRELEYYCDNFLIGKAKTKSMTGNPLTPFEYNGRVPDNYVFLLGDHPDSYDSRYWGFAEKDTLIRGIRII